ncbi:DUF4302 domain-containing protein [Ornithobacterium rhinotracheale]|uniref:DUF4302 domain-containing protein n=1 Tax=Ornithobacterium rhinotracheale TaxID=28251 RepID=UPI004035BFEE
MKKLTNICVAVILAWGVNSCTEDFEPSFSENSTQRYLTVEKEINEFLHTPNSEFVMQYFPDDNQSYGGVNYFLKFPKNDEVISESESNKTPQKSTYRILQNGGAVLSFDLYNKDLHKFATPSSSEYRAKRGDFEFLILKKSSDTIYLKGKKTGNLIKLFKANNISEIKKKIREVALKLDKADFPAKGTLRGKELSVLSPNERNLVFNYEGVDKSNTQKNPYIYTENGIQFYTPIEVNGKKYSDLIYDEQAKVLKSEDGEILISLKFLPINFKTKGWVLDVTKEKDNVSEGYKLARKGDDFIHSFLFKDEGTGLTNYYIIGRNDDKVGFTTFSQKYGGFATYGLKFKGDDKDPRVVYIEKDAPITFDLYFQYVNNVLDKITKNGPYIVEIENPETSQRVKLISKDHPELWFYLFAL